MSLEAMEASTEKILICCPDFHTMTRRISLSALERPLDGVELTVGVFTLSRVVIDIASDGFILEKMKSAAKNSVRLSAVLASTLTGVWKWSDGTWYRTNTNTRDPESWGRYGRRGYDAF